MLSKYWPQTGLNEFFFFFFCSIWFINCRYENSYLNSDHDWRLISLGPLNHLSGGGVGGRCGLPGTLTVHVHQLGQVEPGAPHDLHLADVHVMKRVDAWKIQDLDLNL